ncbi:hypothetical protein MVES1_003438 [Malassezia vespertilionis]|uniref:Uncharacterized protein n=1 Tax=Malassezia vespertilionis TaxID=2020962 RepID=A0A2N1J7N7_9BASI|nr:uncharacterized protein MVES1_003438 [Malassezia vespertilionis]PKI82472.1 hypothetical protein MVES_003676 [Malassezia vespertilionis]WFD08069.1 hypothetical protein MVES1_003438 [Malassezia vespertilionis]
MTGAEGDIAMLLDAPQAITSPTPFLAPDTIFHLSGSTATSHSAQDDRIQAILAFLSDPEKARACAALQVIETPDFKPANAPSSLARTRGASAVVDDMSDAAFRARHAKPERMEKRLRHQEKETLVRDRRRHLNRIAALERVNVARLVPMLAAREQEQGRAVQSEVAYTEHLSLLQERLLAEAHATLQRYDTLLPGEARASSGASAQRVKSRAPLSTRLGPSLHELSNEVCTLYPDRTRQHPDTAFGERVPDYLTRSAPFEEAIAEFLA